MRRKDCDKSNHASGRDRPGRLSRRVWLAAGAILIGWAMAPTGFAGSVRLWPSAAVVDDGVRLTDVSELSGFDPEVERTLCDLIVAEAPPAGGTRVLHLDLIRSALVAAGTNMATVTLRGATQCSVSRPSIPESPAPAKILPVAGSGGPGRWAASGTCPRGVAPPVDSPRTFPATAPTLRQAVVNYFNLELERYGGRAEVIFDRSSAQVLDLSGPPYEFVIRRRKGSPLGLTSIEVEVLADGRVVQSVPLVVQVTMMRQAVAARRAINQDATVHPEDLGLVALSVTCLDRLGFDEIEMVAGQRARRFIPVGTLIEPGMLEEVPLVQRGELVTLASVVGGVRVVTTAKAAETGLRGELVKVRAVDRKGIEFDAVVVGPGAVEVGARSTIREGARVAMGGPL